jgi:peptide-methionine (S)-S-oxide reductase
MEKATFAAGCFWCLEEAFSDIHGVFSTRVGYTGGDFAHPTYQDICSGNTGHAEAIQILFEPHSVVYQQLLQIFWQCHDPTSLNRQGANVGSQYRSAIFYHNEAQKKAAIASMERIQNQSRTNKEVVTEILPAGEFYPAEEYHQQYYAKRKMGLSANIS